MGARRQKQIANRRVLLVNPPQGLDEVMGNAGKFVSRWEPLGLLYLGAVLIEQGYEVKVIDAEADPHTVDQILQTVSFFDPAVVGLTCLTPTAPATVELGLRLESEHPERTVIMGNIHAREFPEVLLRLGSCDFIVRSEGERTFVELLACLEAKDDPAKVDGICFLDEETQYIATPDRPLIEDLDSIPPPARRLLDHIVYDAGMINNMTFIRPEGTVSKHALSSRGCVFECSFCVVHQKRQFRMHNPVRVVDEMVDLVENYNCGYLFFIDSLFVGSKDHVYGVCNEILRRGLKLPWGCEGHVRTVDKEMLRLMKSAGCVNIAYGIESGSPRILKQIGKRTQLHHIEEAIRLTRSMDIAATGLFILGLPGESKVEMEATIELANRLPLDLAQYSMFVPYPGSKDYRELAALGAIDTGVASDGSVDLSVWQRYSPYVGYGNAGGAIYVPPGFTFDELFRMQQRALRSFFLRPHQVLNQVKRLRPSNVIDAAKAAGTLFFQKPPPEKAAPRKRLVKPKYPQVSPPPQMLSVRGP